MPSFDLPLEELRARRTERAEPADLDRFWKTELDTARAARTKPELHAYRPELFRDVAVWDATFSGCGGQPVHAWFMHPREVGSSYPGVVEFIGYGGGRSLPHERLQLVALGFAVFVMDTRGQGGTSSAGATGDGAYAGPSNAGAMTRGIADPSSYYYTRLYVDAVRAVDEFSQFDIVDETRVGVMGGSQGGGLALAASALAPERVAACVAGVPFLCDIVRGARISPDLPYRELAEFFAVHPDQVENFERTLDYVDCAHLAGRIRARTLVSCGLMDSVCPPSTIFAAYNAIEAEKEIVVSPYGTHVVPASFVERGLEWLAPLRRGG